MDFAFRFTRAYRIAALPFGVTPSSTGLTLTDDELRIRFGPWRVATPLSNVVGAELTGPYAFVKTAGPARLGITDLDLTFATNGDAGLLIAFARPIRGIEPTGLLRHRELTVTVADTTGLAENLHTHDGGRP